jgi:hypothetical protein
LCDDPHMRSHARLATAILGVGLFTAALVTATAAAAVAVPGAPSAPARSGGWRSTAVRSPAGGSYGSLAGIACTAKASCTAGGSYEATAAKSGEPMIVTESSGRWSRGVTIGLPANAATTDGSATIASVSCPSRTGCVAVGNYALPTNALHGLITTGHATTWSTARTPLLPKGSAVSAESFLTGVSCTRPGSCVAVGGYTTLADSSEAMAETESGGHWQRAVIVSPPTNASSNPSAHFSAVSCPKAGDCVAVGGYTTKSLDEEVMAAVEVRGKWGRALEIQMPSDASAEPQAELYSVSCPSDRRCEAVGSYVTTAGRGLPLTVAGSGGHWHRAIGVTGLPAGAEYAAQDATLNGVTCRGSSCVAVGAYETTAGVSMAMAISESRGRWNHPVEVGTPPHAASGSDQDATLFGVACSTAADCTAVGQYINAARVNEAMAATRS